MIDRSPIAAPYPHYMAFAPLDAWARVLVGEREFKGRDIPPRFWLRLAGALATSVLGTLLTLPERLLLAPVLRWRGAASGYVVDRPALVVLGYFRSGTTHLQYLLTCDPNFATPKWHQALAPQGWILSWIFLRLFLVPFMGGKRPMDDVEYGPDWPTEDDFAANNWAAASGLIGKMVYTSPEQYERFRRYHFLRGLSGGQLRRWQRAMWAFLWKFSKVVGERGLLLKSPSHTARACEVAALFPPGKAKFIHIGRSPLAVVRSNLTMHHRHHTHQMQEPASDDTLRERIAREYLDTEAAFDEAATKLPPGTLARVRFEDLRADPIGQLKRCYAELDLPWTDAFERNLVTYLRTVEGYKPATSEKAGDERPLSVARELEALSTRRGHHAPPVPKQALPAPASPPSTASTSRRIALASTLAFLIGAATWIATANLLGSHQNWFVWPAGVLIGGWLIRVAKVGSTRLGALAAALTLALTVAVAFPNTRTINYRVNPHPPEPVKFFPEVWDTSIKQLTKNSTIFWAFMGTLTAYRFASRRYVSPFGKS
ncbi:MAG: sulfotransferase [Planctomycetota bacterium]|nr:sulfotransferase [Planctomycetota bacterium]